MDDIDRKMLAELAVKDAAGFAQVAAQAKIAAQAKTAAASKKPQAKPAA